MVVEAPREAIEGILARHPEVAALFENGWLHCLAMGEGGPARREAGGAWRPIGAEAAAEPAPDAVPA